MSYAGNPSNLASSAGVVYGWQKVTKAYTDFSAAAKVKSVTLYTMPAGAILVGVKTKVSTAFTGGGATYVDMRIGNAVSDPHDLGIYDPGIDLFSAAASDNIAYTIVQKACDQVSTTPMVATVTSDVNLDTLAAGSVTVWFLINTAV